MSATRELIAAALAECDLMTGMLGYEPASLRDLRESCARAMVQPAPDKAEVEMLVREYGNACRSDAVDVIATGDDPESCGAAHAALLDYVRGVLAERDALIADNDPLPVVQGLIERVLSVSKASAERGGWSGTVSACDRIETELRMVSAIWRRLKTDLDQAHSQCSKLAVRLAHNQFRDAAKMVPEDPTPAMLDAAERIDWSDSDERGNCVKLWHVMFAAAPQPVGEVKDAAPEMVKGGRYNWKHQKERLIYLGRNRSGNGFWHQFAKVDSPADVWREVVDADLHMIEKTPQPVSAAEVPMPDIAGELFDGKRVCDEADVRTYGDAREAAGYAAGVAAGGKDAERLDFLSRQFVTVRTPMRYGSIECITGMPTDGDGESKPWNIRAAVDAAMRWEVK